MLTIPDVMAPSLSPCPACGSREWRNTGQVKDYSVSGEWFEIYECADCHLKRTYPAPAESGMDRYYASTEYISHSDTRKGLINKLYHAVRDYMLKKKFRWVTEASGLQKGTLLDVGAGTGHFVAFMKSHGWNIAGLEPDAHAREVAFQKNGITLLPSDHLAEQQSHAFDVITLWHVLEHVHDLSGYMDHFRRILKPEGILMIAVPNHTSVDASRYGAQWAAFDVPRHLWHFSPSSMEKLMAKHGFTIREEIPMPLDAFYVSMLSERYKGNDVLGPLSGFRSGLRTYFSSKKNIRRASSIIYVARLTSGS